MENLNSGVSGTTETQETQKATASDNLTTPEVTAVVPSPVSAPAVTNVVDTDDEALFDHVRPGLVKRSLSRVYEITCGSRLRVALTVASIWGGVHFSNNQYESTFRQDCSVVVAKTKRIEQITEKLKHDLENIEIMKELDWDDNLEHAQENYRNQLGVNLERLKTCRDDRHSKDGSIKEDVYKEKEELIKKLTEDSNVPKGSGWKESLVSTWHSINQ